MTDNELILAISDLLDKKIKPIDERFNKMEISFDEKLERMETKFDEKLRRMETKFDERFRRMESNFDERLKRMESNFDERLKRIEMLQENDILPRLQNIEACYTSTYERYQAGVEQIDAMRADIDVIKHVVLEHSERLQKIS